MCLDPNPGTDYVPAACEYFTCKSCNKLYKVGSKTCPHCGANIVPEARVLVTGPNGKPMWIPASAVGTWKKGQSMSQEELARRKADLLEKLKDRTPALPHAPPEIAQTANDIAVLGYLEITQSDFFDLFEKYKIEHYDFESAQNKVSPYSGLPITTEEEYISYLREHFFYRLCVAKSQELCQTYRASQESLISKLNDENSYLLTDNQHKSQRINVLYNEKDYAEKVFRRAALFLLVLCIACSIFFHHRGSKSGYQEGEAAGYESGYHVGHADGYESGHEAGSADGYDRGYDFGYSAGERDAASFSTYSSGSTNTGIGSTRDTAIADGYIGNLNSHKFHYSWCSYLPDQENQIVFSSRDAAVSAGYDPCGRCHP